MEVSLLDLAFARRVTRSQTRLSAMQSASLAATKVEDPSCTFAQNRDRTYAAVLKGEKSHVTSSGSRSMTKTTNLQLAIPRMRATPPFITQVVPTPSFEAPVVPSPRSKSLVVPSLSSLTFLDENTGLGRNKELLCYKKKPRKEKEGCLFATRSVSSSIKFLCSYGGKVVETTSDKKLSYVGGNSRLLKVDYDISYEELMKKIGEFYSKVENIWCQLPGSEELDVMVSILTDIDIKNVVEEHSKLEGTSNSSWLRLFLFSKPNSLKECLQSTHVNNIGIKRPLAGGVTKSEGLKKKSRKYKQGSRINSMSKLSLCETCNVQVPMSVKSQEEHYNSPSHKRKLEVSILHPFFLDHSLDWVNDGKEYVCLGCKKILQVDAQKLLKHVQKYHTGKELKPTRLNDLLQPNTENIIEVFRNKIWLTDFDTKNEVLNKQLEVYGEISSPCTLVESGPHSKIICDLKNKVFTKEDLTVIKRAANYLELNGDKISRSEAKDSFALCAFGMQWTRGDTGWYHHSRKDCYKLSEELATFVTGKLRKNFEKVFIHLDKIKEMEGFNKEDACVGNSPFTTFSITRDFKCRPHLDHDDYDVGFVIWLHEGTVVNNQHPGLFSFPEVKTSFYPQHGDVLLFSPKSIYHCTRRLRKKNLIGLAFFQKCSLFRQLFKLIDSGQTEYIDEKTEEKVVQYREQFFYKKETYKRECLEGRVTLDLFK